MIVELLSIVSPIFIMVAVGFVWTRLGRPLDAEMVTPLVFWIGAPCLVFSILANVSLDPAAVGQIAAAALATFFGVGAAGYVVLRLLRQPVRVFLPSIIFGNGGNIGLPLCLLTFGETGLALGVTVFMIQAVLNHTVGPAISAGVFSPRNVLKVPMVYAAVLALAFLLSGTHPPAFLSNTTRILGGMTIPLLLITLGASLARLRVTGLMRSVLLSLLRFGLGFAVAMAAAAAFGLEGLPRAVLIVQSSLPVAVFNFLFAQRYTERPDDVAALVVVSTTLGILVIPVLIWFVLGPAGM